MEEIEEVDVPEIAEEYGAETFVSVDRIYYDPEFERVNVEVEDPDAVEGYYAYSFDAEKRGGDAVITGSAVGVPDDIEHARSLPHVTPIDILDEVEGIRFEEDGE